MDTCLPVRRTNNRVLAEDFTGDVFVWDVDKTYLDSHFSSSTDLLSFLIEFAVDKQAIAGAVPLLHAIRRGPGPGYRETPLYFVSASPPQLGPVIERKLLLDGIEHDGIAFKDQVNYIKKLKLKMLRRHLSYKLAALLQYCSELPVSTDWFLFGDDAEEDAHIYSMFSSVTAGDMSPADLGGKLAKEGVPACEVEELVDLASSITTKRRVVAIFIHLTKGVSPWEIDGRDVLACRDYLQAGVVLWAMGKISLEGVRAVAADLKSRGQDIESSIEDCMQRLALLDKRQKVVLLDKVLA